MPNDFIPDADADFDEWEQNYLTHVNAGSAAWAIPAPRVAALNARQTQWATDYAAGGKHVDRKSSEALKKIQTRILFEKEIRAFNQEFIAFSSLITDDDRRAMKVTVRDTEPSPRPQITTAPNLKLIVQQGARFMVENRVESDSTRASMHPYADAIELRYKIGDPLPASAADCDQTKVVSKARYLLMLDPAVAGQKVHMFSRWLNTTDESKSSQYTRLHSAMISD